MKNPNGYGTIKHLAGNRRRPFALIISDSGNRRAVGFYETREKALAAQAKLYVQRGGYRPRSLTFAALYELWLPLHAARHDVSQSALNGYRASFNHCRALWEKPVERIRYSDVQSVLDSMKKAGLSYSSRKKCRSLINLLFKFARVNEYASQNFAGMMYIGKNKKVRPHRSFTRQAINRLWKSDASGVGSVLFLIYTGLRVSEMLNLRKHDVNRRRRFISITRSKTEAGVRVVPVHPLLTPILNAQLATAGEFLFPAPDGHQMTYAEYRRVWDSVMRSIHSHYTPHDTRHTFASLLDAAEVNDNARRRLLGHAGGSITDSVYTHKTMRQLRAAVEKLR